MIILHQWEMSPFCNKTRRCLRHKGLAFSVRDYNGLEARKAQKLSKRGTLPVLEDDGRLIVDSGAIAAFLDEKYPDKPLYPADPEIRAMARIWEDWAGESLMFYALYLRMMDPVARKKAVALICAGRPAWERLVMGIFFRWEYPKRLRAHGVGRQSEADIEGHVLAKLDDLERILSAREWLVGDAASIADFSVAAQLDEMVRTSRLAPQILAHEKVAGWLKRL